MTHYSHKNIVRGTTKWDLSDKTDDGVRASHMVRDFNTLEEHDEAIIKGINDTVKYNDILYFLGDWSFNGHENIKKFRERIECMTIHFIFGNHDQHIEPTGSVYRDLFTSVQYVLNVSHGSHKFFLSHYSHRIWAGSHKGVIHLFGHSHSSLDNKPHGKSMDVGIDSYFKLHGEYKPFSIEEVISIMDKRDIKFIDHHSSKTN